MWSFGMFGGQYILTLIKLAPVLRLPMIRITSQNIPQTSNSLFSPSHPIVLDLVP